MNTRAILLTCTLLFLAAPSTGWSDPPPAPLAQSGQTTQYQSGDDGHLEKGVAWPTPRFTESGNGTVIDQLTGLVWMKNANCWGRQSWSGSLESMVALNNGTQNCSGYSGTHTDWRLPNIDELQSLIDYSRSSSLPAGHPFTGVQYSNYWSSTSYAGNPNNAWNLSFSNGYVGTGTKTNTFYPWPVRGGQ
ncbi:MAG: DUF1566 domain-containing protein [Magnetococcales bacterium]|nr:DUF1566 domain-containing protein [Magnetococcales bacterium]NGZ06236.1 DUF1566 domain-containing protein [Magnetococcales bacterium]